MLMASSRWILSECDGGSINNRTVFLNSCLCPGREAHPEQLDSDGIQEEVQEPGAEPPPHQTHKTSLKIRDTPAENTRDRHKELFNS